MTEQLKNFLFSDDKYRSWLFKDYYFAGSNSRYWTFQMALNLLLQKKEGNKVIIETGCQRMADDLGAGMSSSIFGKFCQEFGGQLHTIDISPDAINACKSCTTQYASVIHYHLSDSLKWLRESKMKADLIYLDSYDYPYGDILNFYGGQRDIQSAIKIVDSLSRDELLARHSNLIIPCQEHTLNEFILAEQNRIIDSKTIVMTDDNQLPGGGKPRLFKDYLLDNGWTCLLDHQQSLWIKR